MKKVQKTERVAAIVNILTENPNKIFTLTYFCDIFKCVKSTISEDIDGIKEVFKSYELGAIETISGAAGGVYYNPLMMPGRMLEFTTELCDKLNDPARIIPGGYLYTNDLLYCPSTCSKIGNALASLFADIEIDYVITVETKGIPIAMMTARVLNKPMVVVRNKSKLTDGTVIYMNYMSSSGHVIKTMCLSTKAVKKGSKVLFIDDFMKAGGTAKGIIELMQEFDSEVVGVGVLMATKTPTEKLYHSYKSLLLLNKIDEKDKKVYIQSALKQQVIE